MVLGEIVVAAFVLLLVISFDVLALGFSFGTSGVRVPFGRLFMVSLIGSVMLGLSLVLGHLVGELVHPDVVMWSAFGLFMAVGLFKVASWVYAPRDGEESQGDRTITLLGCVTLALMLSLDGLGVGLAVGIGAITWVFIAVIFAVSLFSEIALFRLGQLLGRTLRKSTRRDVGWLPGTILIVLAFVGLFI